MSRRTVIPGTLLLLAVAVTLVLWATGPRAVPPGGHSFPPLPPLPAACQASESQAAVWARRSASEADAHAARYAFDAREGLLASALYAEAAACAQGGERVAASARSGQFRKRLEGDYTAHRVALSVAVERADWPAVKRDASWLRRLVSDPTASVSTWLAELERRAEAGGE